MAVNADGSQLNYLYGYRGSESVTSRARQGTKDYGFGYVVRTLPNDPRHAVISVTRMTNYQTRSALTTPQLIDLYTGDLTKLASPPSEGHYRYLANKDGKVVFATGSSTDDGEGKSYMRNPQTGNWRELPHLGDEVQAQPLDVAEDGKSIYLSARLDGDRSCLVSHSLEGDQIQSLACHPASDLRGVYQSPVDRVPIAAVFEAGRPEMVTLSIDHPDAVLMKSLAASFPGQLVSPTSWSADGSKLVIRVASDRNSGEFYLYDRNSRKAQFLLSAADWLDPATMAEQRPVSFQSRDGRSLYGYITLPPRRDPKNLPLVVNPHGGPFGIEDEWGWDADSQMLANRGYAVLKVNFRGSGGYGGKYEDAAKRGWGTTMIDDITDGVRWSISQGLVDPARVCIFGGSYGGYASLMSAVREPDLYKCAIGYVGVYDLALWAEDTDVSEWGGGRRYINEFVGDEKILQEQSPIAYLDRLKAPVFIVHGEDDRRVPFNQAKALRKALDKRKHPYEWMSKLKEGHGFANEENRVELYQRMLKFLEQNIGPGAPEEQAVPAKP